MGSERSVAIFVARLDFEAGFVLPTRASPFDGYLWCSLATAWRQADPNPATALTNSLAFILYVSDLSWRIEINFMLQSN